MSAKSSGSWTRIFLWAAGVGTLAAGVLGLAGCRRERVIVIRESPPVVMAERPAVIVTQPPPPQVIYVREAPPAPIVEVISVAPGPGYIWVGGFHEWRGAHYVWVRGYYSLPPRGFSIWIGDRWHHDDHGWRHERGHWR